MKLTVLGSSSAGNCYILENDTEALIIEAGVNFTEVKRALRFRISKISAVLCTHEHGDHGAYLKKYINAGFPVVASAGTLSALSIAPGVVKPTTAEKTVKFGGFSIMAFDVQHDAAEPYGFLISHPETGTILFATDTADIPCEVKGLNNLLIEANYSDEIVYERIYSGSLNAKQQERTTKSHMSIKTCIDFLESNDLRAVNNIVLIHLSDGNSNAVEFKTSVERATGKTVHIANKGLSIEFNKHPY